MTPEQIAAFVPIKGQSFSCQQDWVNRASRVLTGHAEYRNTEHDGPATGWRGYHFTALCFDQQGRRCRNGGDFQRAEDDGAYPIWWIWPDQVASTVLTQQTQITALAEDAARAHDLALENARLREALKPNGDTKAAFIGEFSFSIEMPDEDGEPQSVKIPVPWTTVKEIMAAITNRAGTHTATAAVLSARDSIPEGE